MAPKLATKVQELPADAQLLTLTMTEAAQLMASRIERKGAEISGITVVVSLGNDNYLKSRLPDDAVGALVQKIRTLQPAERLAFVGEWMSRARDVMSVAYQQAAAASPKTTRFTYPLPPLELPKAEAPTTPMGKLYAPMPVIPTKTEMALDTAKAKPKVPLNAALSPLPKGVKGKGTTEKPYLIDLTDKAPREGPKQDLVMPITYSIVGLDTEVHVKYTLRVNQVKEILNSRSSDMSMEIRSITSQSIEHYGAERGVTGDALPDFTNSLESAMRELPGKIGAFARQVQDPKIRAYLGLE